MVDPVRLIHITDTHLFADKSKKLLGINTAYSLEMIIDYIKTHETKKHMVIATGDIAQEASVQTYKNFMDITQVLTARRLCLAGNHDELNELNTQCAGLIHSSYDLNSHWRMVMLNTQVVGSNAGFIEKSQLNVLTKACKAAPAKHVLVAMHHNPVPVGSLWLDTMMIANANELLLLVKQLTNVKLLVWGHVHQEYDSHYALSTSVTEPTRYVRLLATPSTCVQFKPRSPQFAVDTLMPGYRWIDLYANGTLETGVVRVPIPNLHADLTSSGY